MKLAFIDKLTELAESDPRIVLMTGDLGFQIFDNFKARHGPRYVNVGVAEAQMICAAAGLAYVGYRPVTYSIASFATARCFEQIKVSVAYAGLPVVIVGAGGGYAYCESGVTHHAGEDLALLCSLPGMTVVAPGDANEIRALLPQVMQLPGPTYFRIGRGKEPLYESDTPVELGKARLLQDGQDVAVLSTGEVAGELVEALKILDAKGVRPIAYQFHTVKPLDTAALAGLIGRARSILVVEEHVPHGGLASQVGDWLSRQESAPRLTSLSVSDSFVLGSPKKHEMRADFQLNAEGVARAIVELAGR